MAVRGSSGFSLIETITVLVVIGIVGSLAAPRMEEHTHRLRVRIALDRLTSDIYRARAVAARRAIRVHINFLPNRGCAHSYVMRRADNSVVLDSVVFATRTPGVCISSSIPQGMVINSRGMLVGSPRTVRGVAGAQRDSMTISIAGRVYRWY